MGKITEIYENFYEKYEVYFVIISIISLIVSFFDIGNLPINAAWIAVILCGLPIIREAFIGMVTEFDIKADLLVSLALIASVLIGELFAAGEIAVIMTIGAMLEDRTVAKARAGIEKLVELSPQTARLLKDGAEMIIPSADVLKGNHLRVLAGETVPADGHITSGHTTVDQSVITGESLPVDKEVGDEVFSGTVNQFGTFDMVASKSGEDSSLQRMVKLVESADAEKAKSVRIADKFATWIVIIALTAAALTWFATGEVIRAVTILVVFCPCALVLATPTAIMAAIGNVTKYGILVREGDALERLSKTTKIFFDKTGTLTRGNPVVTRIHILSDDYSNDLLLQIAASAELKSEHPLGKAIVKHYKEIRGALPIEPEDTDIVPGRGVKADISGKSVLVGNEKLFNKFDLPVPSAISGIAQKDLDCGSTVVYMTIDSVFVGFIVLSDTVRTESSKVVSAIQDAGIGCVMLTGDGRASAQYIAGSVGISEVLYDSLPEDKLNAVKKGRDDGEFVCMIGDGINDAPALKSANTGIAMGGIGSDIAIDAADIVLVSDNISNLPHLLLLSRKMMTTIKINFAFSLGLNFVAIILAMTGILTPVTGALVHNLGSVLVIINSAFLLNRKPQKLKKEIGEPPVQMPETETPLCKNVSEKEASSF
ncbi:Cadmium-transporting ATPase [Methanimicrococcus hongohii]|uniref:Cadmium-transporting ATPase n=1 Tax=Methanimicrococcus hongohii TaxID=3028295 RepID=A0AA96V8L3_9EURY|nr:cation-translocating P-type ATPase [Methanimicrococcus sp. Hf6]WNY23461.1 Cadmium-transporting ATPase [Methanimicrococcus sp. Hf6]